MDSLFDSLPEKTQLLIDEAFDQSITSAHNSGQKARNRGSPTPSVSNNGADGGGGFILDEDVEMGSGGFVIENEDETTRHSPAEQIPVRLIPSALQLLDLPPDDEEILSVFKNAASGWTSSSISAFAGAEANEKYVSRDDWRSVCAVLLDTRDNVDGTSEEDPAMKSDGYTEEVSIDEFDSDEEYTETKKASVRRGKRPQRDRSAPSTTNKATKRQRETCLDAYALFFPDVPSAELHKQMIKVSDLQRAFKLLGERIKADEMVEMLEMFSSNPNKTMDFDDFTRMMMTAKLA
ncbi:hypothetical protein CPC08DRAFT_432132 [Agrocybe pediades]|nr:hypothetical protein CPC08DRAFT_432132 [Agrocybe pediades]